MLCCFVLFYFVWKSSLFWFIFTCTAKKGSHAILAAHSCKEINDIGETRGDGEYWIDPENTGKPFTVYCDMTTDSGNDNPSLVETSKMKMTKNSVGMFLLLSSVRRPLLVLFYSSFNSATLPPSLPFFSSPPPPFRPFPSSFSLFLIFFSSFFFSSFSAPLSPLPHPQLLPLLLLLLLL